jgi:uncharacterized protein DUF4388
MDTRILILNADPVFQDLSLSVFDGLDSLETRIVRTLAEAIHSLLAENFDAFVIEGEARAAVDQATHARQHFPSLRIACLNAEHGAQDVSAAEQQKIELIRRPRTKSGIRRKINAFVRSLDVHAGPSAEGIDPCHSLVGNLSQFPAAEILQMSCLSQRSGRFTFKSGRGNSEIYLQQGAIRHAVFEELEGEPVVAEIFRWRQGRFYFEEGVISQVQSVDRPWPHLLIDNLQKLDETLELVSVR